MITDAIWRQDLPIRIFTLDTGRLFEETLALMDATRANTGARSRCSCQTPPNSKPS